MGVTVRALHHYDTFGLLRSSTRSDTDYRLYGEKDIRVLRRTRRDQALGFSLDEIRELPNASRKHRLTALRTRRDAVRQRAAQRPPTSSVPLTERSPRKNGDGAQPPDLLGRAEALVSEYLEQSTSTTVPRISALPAQALDVLRPLATGPTMDAAAVRLTVWIHGCRHDWANVADVCQRLLGADRGLGGPGVRRARGRRGADAAWAARGGRRGTSHPHCGGHGRAPTKGVGRCDGQFDNGACRITTGKRDASVKLFRVVDAGTRATAENRASRYEQLHTAVMLMGADRDTYGREIDALAQRMAETSLRRIRVGTSAYGQRTGSNNRNRETRFAAANRRP